MSPFNPELSAVPGITGLARWGEQWWHRGGGAKVRAILVKEAFVRPASVNPRASLPTAGARGGAGDMSTPGGIKGSVLGPWQGQVCVAQPLGRWEAAPHRPQEPNGSL